MRCAVYIRVSTDKLEQRKSLTNQKELFLNYIADKGWDLEKLYVDVETGTTDKRQQLQQLIEDAKQKKFDIILAKELSRLARNGGLSYQIRDIAERHRVDIITLDNAINTLENNNQMFGLYAWMYEQESQRTSDRVKAALRNRAKNGLFKGSNAPYGYEVINGKLSIRNDETPDVIRRIYREYMQGNGFDRIARGLYEDGIPTPAQIAGKKNASDKWMGSSVRVLLTNPHYTGALVQGRTTTKSVTSKLRDDVDENTHIIHLDSHEAIISKEDYKVVQQHMKERKRKRPKQEKHLFTNTAFCADCGKSMHFKANKKGYICGNYNKHGHKACTNHHVLDTTLRDTIISDIQALMSSLKSDNFISHTMKEIDIKNKRTEKRIETVQKEIKGLKQRKAKFIINRTDGKMSEEEFEIVNEITNDEIQTLKKKQLYLEESLVIQQNESSLKEITKQIEEIVKLNELSPELLHRLINRIEIKADGSPRIFYKFSSNHLLTF